MEEKKTNIALEKSVQTAALIKDLCVRAKPKKGDAFFDTVVNQVSRSSTSVSANIAESNVTHGSLKVRSKALSIALGENNETLTWIDMLIAMGFVDSEDEDVKKIQDNLDHIRIILHKSLTTLNKRINSNNTP